MYVSCVLRLFIHVWRYYRVSWFGNSVLVFYGMPIDDIHENHRFAALMAHYKGMRLARENGGFAAFVPHYLHKVLFSPREVHDHVNVECSSYTWTDCNFLLLLFLLLLFFSSRTWKFIRDTPSTTGLQRQICSGKIKRREITKLRARRTYLTYLLTACRLLAGNECGYRHDLSL